MIEEKIRKCDFVIGYIPRSSEVQYEQALSMYSIPPPCVCVPQEKNADPFLWSKKCVAAAQQSRVCIFVPGVLFDVYGNRKGHGGGWYDRFLSSLPHTWLRIGVCHTSQVSQARLRMNPWDIPMNGLLTHDIEADTWEIFDVL